MYKSHEKYINIAEMIMGIIDKSRNVFPAM
jgi:hypothetical protein